VLALSNDTSPVLAVAAEQVSLGDARKTALAAVKAAGGSEGKRVVVVNAKGALPAGVFLVSRPGSLDALEVVVSLTDGAVLSIKNTTRE
jgi:hypothetical protein